MRLPLLYLCLLATLSSAAGAKTLFPEEVRVSDRGFVKLGEYRYVYRFFFDLYDAALFVEPGAGATEVLEAARAFHLEFRYLREIDKSIILKSAERMLEKNLSAGERAQIAERVDQLNEAYTTVRDGDRSSLTFEPEEGTTLRINGEVVKTIPGRDFATLYFRIWLGPQAISQSLKSHLLGQK